MKNTKKKKKNSTACLVLDMTKTQIVHHQFQDTQDILSKYLQQNEPEPSQKPQKSFTIRILSAITIITATLSILALINSIEYKNSSKRRNSSLNFNQLHPDTTRTLIDDTEHWVILSFLPENLEDFWLSKLWYTQLSKLGYQNHFLVASEEKHQTLDTLTFRTVDAINKTTDNKIDSYISNNFSKLSIVKSFLEKGSNVLVSSPSAIWLKFLPLSTYLPKNFDILQHSNEEKIAVNDISAFYSTSATINLLNKLIKSGETQWRSISEYSNGNSPEYWLESDSFKYVSRYYNASTPTLEGDVVTKHDVTVKTMLLSNDIVASGTSRTINCRKRNKLSGPLWVVVPNISQTGMKSDGKKLSLNQTADQFRYCYDREVFGRL